ncbi:APC family permease [Conexibacter sp. S30A1]|uniref:APC family permease n=1 Tax=Conexibacter sp. S30A1 TaxID=2937800 RepID=UPI00200EF345|nr:amino acid permease [Conexibacter sp. S30A1]
MQDQLRHGDDAAVREMGYVQRLDRSLGHFALFALQYSYLSVLTGIFELFGFGYLFAGPASIWAWTFVFGGQLMVALLFCELGAEWPVAGSVYNWSKKLGHGWSAWMAGWMVLFTAITTVAAVALAAQIVLPTVSPFFQFIGSGSNPSNYAENAVLLGGIMIVLTTIINSLRVKVVGFVNNLTVLAELGICVLLIVLLLVHVHRSPDVIFRSLGAGKGYSWGFFGAFLAAMLFGGYQWYGFDTAASLAEEAPDPHKRAPRSILQALTATFVLGFLLILVAYMAVPNVSASGIGTGGLAYVVDKVLGTTLGDVMLVGVMVAVFGCALAIQAAATRIMFAMARDGQLPFSRRLAHVNETSKAVVIPTVITGVIAVALLLINIKSSQIIYIVTSIAIITNSVAYLCVTVPLLIARLQGRWPRQQPAGAAKRFTLGRFGLPLNIAAVVWGVGLTVDLIWPRGSIYNATAPFHWYLRFGPLLAIGILLIGGSLYYIRASKRGITILDEHSASEATRTVAAAAAAIPAPLESTGA